MNKKTTAIIVDDDETIVDVFSEYLELFDMKVVSVGYDGKEAVELYKKYRPDIIFLDLNMPQYDGIYALTEIQTFDSNAKIVIVTADLNSDVFEKLERLKPTEIFFNKIDMKKMKILLDRLTQTKDFSFVLDTEKKIARNLYNNQDT
ncbi:MAG: response regulator [Pseudomonadota bacterium]